MHARLCACVVAGLFGIVPLVAAAEPASADGERETFGAVELRWRAPVECPRAAELRGRIERETASAMAGDLPLSVLVDAEVVARADGRMTMRARTSSATGASERSWIADDCETLAEVAVVLLVGALEQVSGEPLSNPLPNPNPLPLPNPDPNPNPEPEPKPESGVALREAGRLRGPSLGVRPSLGVEISGLPRAGLATGLAFVVAWRFARLEVAGLYAAPRFTERSGGAGAALQLASFSVRGCGRVLTRWIELPLCAGLEVGAVLGRGVGVENPRRDRVLWGAVVFGPGLVVRAHPRLGIVLDGHVAMPLGRPSFVLDPYGTVWRARIGGRVLAGLEVWFR